MAVGSNGHVRHFDDPILLRQVQNVMSQVNNLAGPPNRAAWFQGGNGMQPDPRRSLEDEYGWPVAPGPDVYDRLYNWDTIAAKIVSLPAWQCWKVDPWVYEDEDEEVETDFEASFDEMISGLRGDDNYYRPSPEQGGNPFFESFRRLDILHRRGRYGVMWYGFDDGEDPRTPVPGITENHSFPIVFNANDKKIEWVNGRPREGRRYPHSVARNARTVKGRRLLFLKPFPESQAVVTRWEGNRDSPRYLHPVEYRITEIDPSAGYTGLGLPTSEVTVHWSRVTHHADTYHHAVGGGGQLATPALQVPLYDVLDARKVSGASPEAFYRAAITRIFFETLPQFGADAIVNLDEIQDMMEDMENTMQKHGVLKGLHANPVAPGVTDPTPHLDAKYKRVAIYLNKPKRIFEGSERGEMSSGQDERQDEDDIAGRQNRYCSASLLAPAINRLIYVGVNSEPGEDGFKIEWPPVKNENETEKADVFSKRSAAFAAALGGNVPAFLGDRNFLTDEAGFSADRADQILEDQEEQALEQEEANLELADEMGLDPAPPDGFQAPPEELPPEPVKVKPGEKLVIPPTANLDYPWDTDLLTENFNPNHGDDGRFISGPGGPGGHSVKLPKNRSKLSIGTAAKALSEMGHSLKPAGFDLKTKTTMYDLTGPDGKSKKVTVDEVKEMVYRGVKGGTRNVDDPDPDDEPEEDEEDEEDDTDEFLADFDPESALYAAELMEAMGADLDAALEALESTENHGKHDQRTHGRARGGATAVKARAKAQFVAGKAAPKPPKQSKKDKALETARSVMESSKSGNLGPTRSSEMAKAFVGLSVPQITGLAKEHNVKLTGKLKSDKAKDLAGKLSEQHQIEITRRLMNADKPKAGKLRKALSAAFKFASTLGMAD